jgi:Holliday junction resolvase RusA-like endonuclease
MIYCLAQYHCQQYQNRNIALPLSIVIRNCELKQKVDSARALAHLVSEENEYFYKDLDNLLKAISDDLRFKRNRLIHDDWIDGPGATAQIQYFGKVKNVQARQREISLRSETIHADTSKLDADLERFRGALDDMLKLHARITLILTRRKENTAPHQQ